MLNIFKKATINQDVLLFVFIIQKDMIVVYLGLSQSIVDYIGYNFLLCFLNILVHFAIFKNNLIFIISFQKTKLLLKRVLNKYVKIKKFQVVIPHLQTKLRSYHAI